MKSLLKKDPWPNKIWCRPLGSKTNKEIILSQPLMFPHIIKKSSYSLEYIKLMETRNPIVVNAPLISNL